MRFFFLETQINSKLLLCPFYLLPGSAEHKGYVFRIFSQKARRAELLISCHDSGSFREAINITGVMLLVWARFVNKDLMGLCLRIFQKGKGAFAYPKYNLLFFLFSKSFFAGLSCTDGCCTRDPRPLLLPTTAIAIYFPFCFFFNPARTQKKGSSPGGRGS